MATNPFMALIKLACPDAGVNCLKMVAVLLYVTIPTLFLPVVLFSGRKILFIKSFAAFCACAIGLVPLPCPILPETSIAKITSRGFEIGLAP